MFLVMMMMIMKETQKRLQKMPVLFWVMKLAAFVRRVWNNQHIVDGHGELASTTTKKLRPSDKIQWNGNVEKKKKKKKG